MSVLPSISNKPQHIDSTSNLFSPDDSTIHDMWKEIAESMRKTDKRKLLNKQMNTNFTTFDKAEKHAKQHYPELLL